MVNIAQTHGACNAKGGALEPSFHSTTGPEHLRSSPIACVGGLLPNDWLNFWATAR